MPPNDDLLNKNFPEDEEARARGMRILSMFAVVVVVVFVVVMGYVYMSGNKSTDPNNLPLITENNPPEKMRPTDPGGMEIPHQDASVYDHLDPKQAADQPEKLLPTAEAPVTPNAAQSASVPSATATPVPEQLPGLPAATPPMVNNNVPPTVVPSQTMQPAASPTQTTATNDVIPSATPTTGGYRIQLGAVRDEAAAQKEWARMQTKYGDQLKGMDSSFTPVSLGDKGTFLRIQAGPLTREEAETSCAKLKLFNQACLVVKASQ